MKKIELDSVIANVYDLEDVIRKMRSELGLKPFMKNPVPIDGQMVPMALFSINGITLEFLEFAHHEPIAGLTQISEVNIGLPIPRSCRVELEASLVINLTPSSTPRIDSLTVNSYNPADDLRILYSLGAETLLDERSCHLRDVEFHFTQQSQSQAQLEHLSYSELSRQSGWRRFSLQGLPIEKMVAFLEEQGCQVVHPIFQVLPGLRECFMRTPSGLILQPIEQQLWKLIPASMWNRFIGLFSRKKMEKVS